MALSDKEIGAEHPEILGAKKLMADASRIKILTRDEGPRGGWIITAKIEGKPCEALIDGDGLVRKGKCVCSWHYKFGIRNGPCRHIQTIREHAFLGTTPDENQGWYEKLLSWAGK